MNELKLAQYALDNLSARRLGEEIGISQADLARLKDGRVALQASPYATVHALAEVALGRLNPEALHIVQKVKTSREGTRFTGMLDFTPSELGDISHWGVRTSYTIARAICSDAPDLMASFVLMMMGRPYAYQARDQFEVLTEAIEAVLFNLQNADLSVRLPNFVASDGTRYYRILANWHLLQDPAGEETWARLATTVQSLEIRWKDHCSLYSPVRVRMTTFQPGKDGDC